MLFVPWAVVMMTLKSIKTLILGHMLCVLVHKHLIRYAPPHFFLKGPVQTPYLSCAVPNTFSLLGRIKRQALPHPEILACLIEICRKKNHFTTAVHLPKNYALLGTAHERHGV